MKSASQIKFAWATEVHIWLNESDSVQWTFIIGKTHSTYLFFFVQLIKRFRRDTCRCRHEIFSYKVMIGQ
jgi:hypothetical protein